MQQFKTEKLFEKFEINEITEDEFRKKMNKEFVKSVSESKIDNAWNKLLLDFPEKNIKIIENLKTKYRLFLLSNTNIIHYKSYIADFRKKFSYEFNSLFESSYYSHEVGLRKPDKLFFRKVINDNNLKPDETLFIDDLQENCNAGKSIGIKTLRLKRNTGLNSITF